MFLTAFIAGALLISSPVIAQSEPVGASVEVNGMQMYYETSGEGDPLIVLHGAYMNIQTMGEIIPVPPGHCHRDAGPWPHERH